MRFVQFLFFKHALVLLAKMRSGTYIDFREGPLTLVNIVEVGD